MAPYSYLSFSLVYTYVKKAEKEATLDLVAPTKQIFDLFLAGLKILWKI
jgi:hypothetical protein